MKLLELRQTRNENVHVLVDAQEMLCVSDKGVCDGAELFDR